MITPRSIRTIRRDSRRTISMIRASLPCAAAHRSASADGITSSSATTAPSAFETIFCATTKTSPRSIVRADFSTAPAIFAPRSSPRTISGRPATPTMWMSDILQWPAGAPPRTVGVDLLGFDLDDEPDFTGLTERVDVLVDVLLAERVDVVVGALLGDLDDPSLDTDVAVRVVGVGNRQRHAGIALEVLRLHAPLRGVDQDVRAVRVPPDRRHLRTPVGIHRREVREGLLVEQIGVGLRNARHGRLQASGF